tara:strand:- start:3412 stop:6411 length:3000 start_codon:yes stop_codon:yes gene_type:complete
MAIVTSALTALKVSKLLAPSAGKKALMGAAKSSAKKGAKNLAKRKVKEFVSGKKEEKIEKGSAIVKSEGIQPLSKKVGDQIIDTSIVPVKPQKAKKVVVKNNFESITKTVESLVKSSNKIIKILNKQKNFQKGQNKKDRIQSEKDKKRKKESLLEKLGSTFKDKVGGLAKKASFNIFDVISKILMGGILVALIKNAKKVAELLDYIGEHFVDPLKFIKASIFAFVAIFPRFSKLIERGLFKLIPFKKQISNISKNIGKKIGKFFKNLGGSVLNFGKNLFKKLSGFGSNLLKKTGVGSVLNFGKNLFKKSVGLVKKGGEIIGSKAKDIAKSFKYTPKNPKKLPVPKKINPRAISIGPAKNIFGKNAVKRLSKVKGLFKRIPVIGALFGIGIDLALGESIDKAIVGAIGSSLGAAIGAGVGSLILPIAGTAAGAFVGGIVGDWLAKELWTKITGLGDLGISQKEKKEFKDKDKDTPSPPGSSGGSSPEEEELKAGDFVMENGAIRVFDGMGTRTPTPSEFSIYYSGRRNINEVQQTSSSSNSGVVGGDSATSDDPYKIAQSMGFSKEDWDNYRNVVGNIESGNRYDIGRGGSDDKYDGRWQLGKAAKTDAANYLGETDPGHGSEARDKFNSSPEMQERYFAAFTAKNFGYLSTHPGFKKLTTREKFQVLGYAHNQGASGARDWLDTGEVRRDGFGTAATKYSNALAEAYSSEKPTESTPQTMNPEDVKPSTSLTPSTSGAFNTGLKTGKSQYIGGSSDYHIDTKFKSSLSMEEKVAMMDQLAAGYEAQGRKIEFSNAAISGAVYDPNAQYEEKAALLQKAFEAHNIPRGRAIDQGGFNSIDYYAPLKDENRFGSSVKGQDILIPTMGGTEVEYHQGGEYGAFVSLTDENDNVLLKTGHGDIRGAKGGQVQLSDGQSQMIETSQPSRPATFSSVSRFATDQIQRKGSYDQPTSYVIMNNQGGGARVSSGGGGSGKQPILIPVGPSLNSFYKKQLLGFLYKQG